MRNIVRLLGLITVILSLGLMGCEKEPLQNDIEQHWRLESFTILATGENVPCKNLFYGITRMVTEVAEKTVSDGHQDNNDSQGLGSFVARTQYRDNGSTLVLSSFKVNGYNTDKKVDATVEQLKPFGINNPSETSFRIIEHADNHLVLESDYARLNLKKF